MTLIDANKKNEIFNVAGGFEQANIDTVKKIIDCYFEDEVDFRDYINFTTRDGQDLRYALNDRKIKDLGWEPKRNFNEEIPSIVSHYKKKFIW